MKDFLRELRRWMNRPVVDEIEKTNLMIARKELSRTAGGAAESINDAELQIFSQHGEDGIIQYLISRVEIKERYFVEFGVDSYRESNTRFLLMNNNWRGLIMDGGKSHIKYIERESYLGVNYDIKAVSAVITPDNIESLLKEAGVPEEPGIISVDIDFNDYFVIKAIKSFKPAIFIAEYNKIFGCSEKISVPFLKGLSRYVSGAYFGASLPAINMCMEEKGYVLSGSDSKGVNAFFVREDLAGNIKKKTVKEVFEGLVFDSGRAWEELKKTGEKPVLEVETGKEKKISEIFGF